MTTNICRQIIVAAMYIHVQSVMLVIILSLLNIILEMLRYVFLMKLKQKLYKINGNNDAHT